MAQPSRSTLTFDGAVLPCISIRVSFATTRDHQGMPNMGSLDTQVRCWIDFHDSEQVQYSHLQSLFDAANVVTQDKIKDAKIEFWKDDSQQDALCSYQFKGWVKGLQMVNPVATPGQQRDNVQNDGGVNHMLIVDLHPAMDNQNVQNIQLSN